MKKIFSLIVITFLAYLLMQVTDAQQKKYHEWWFDRHPGKPLNSRDSKKLPLIEVKENKFVNTNGDTVLFRGLAISDPDKIENQRHWSKNHFIKVKEMGAKIVRIPVHPVAWKERTPENYLRLLDEAVEWCTELGMYIIIDWHTIGNLKMELFQDPMYNTTQRETFEFWRTIARHFSGNNTIAFYELFNEPTLYRGQLGSISWSDWRKLNEEMIDLIRAYDKETIPLVAGFDWAYDLTPIKIEPIREEGIGYVTHPYPSKRSKPYVPKWEGDFGFAADKYPVMASEFGFAIGKETLEENGEYGNTLINYLEEKGISWVGWIFDPDWYPKMFESWDTYKLTPAGEFFKRALHGITLTKLPNKGGEIK